MLVTCLTGIGQSQIYQQPQYQQGQPQVFQQGQPIIRGQVVPQQQRMTQQQPQYSNMTMTEAQKAMPSTGASYYDSTAGVAVRSVYSNGPAFKAGINSGDVISKANGQPLRSAATLNSMVAQMKAGDTIKLTKKSNTGKVSEVACQLMTMSQIIEASNAPDASAYDLAVEKATVLLSKLGQEIKTSESELGDMKKRYASQQKQLEALRVKAKEARVLADKQKIADEEKRKQQMELMKRRAEEAARGGN